MSMAEELLNAITPEPFTKILCLLHNTRTISIEAFKEKRKELMKHHWVDSTILLTPDKKHASVTGIFELFSKKTRLSATELNEMLID